MSYSHEQRQEKSRLPPNLRSTHRSLLDGRAIVHLSIAVNSCRGRNARCGRGKTERSGKLVRQIVVDSSRLCEFMHCLIDLRHPGCYSAVWRGQVVSACLLRSPVSSDCTFIPEGCSVSSRYTFPKGLGSVLSALFSSVKTIPVF